MRETVVLSSRRLLRHARDEHCGGTLAADTVCATPLMLNGEWRCQRLHSLLSAFLSDPDRALSAESRQRKVANVIADASLF
jgi:hypothetical protein